MILLSVAHPGCFILRIRTSFHSGTGTGTKLKRPFSGFLRDQDQALIEAWFHKDNGTKILQLNLENPGSGKNSSRIPYPGGGGV
jgi:hypothetical protein